MVSRRHFIADSAAAGVAAFRNDTLRRLLRAEPSGSLPPRISPSTKGIGRRSGPQILAPLRGAKLIAARTPGSSTRG
ncbi:twin-arginine translocation signal domain-containing protein [Fimbriimonas ginsengisoli]|uniref:twin-arginine translocation signal domain-containing protein n=1 Tax=Fimbriimonas ginsengisoli TaxID=1005039 RepID=UPI00118614D9